VSRHVRRTDAAIAQAGACVGGADLGAEEAAGRTLGLTAEQVQRVYGVSSISAVRRVGYSRRRL